MTTERVPAADLLGDASARLIRTVDGFHGDDWAAPSLLPRWSRAHVVAHLALNAEGIARGLRGVVADDSDGDALEPRTMYDSDEKRDSDIEDLAAAEPSEIRDRLLAGTTLLQEAIEAIPGNRWETTVERTPGGRAIRAGAFPEMRLREMEIHHVDLGAGYSTSDWDLGFAEQLLDAMDKRVRAGRAFEVRPLDSQRTWVFGPGESEYPVPVVTGPAADLGWWLTGRPAPTTLSCSQGELPTIEGW
ncbi:MAG TPA: maleylpyruvate isomerase family mycothiol-dependent enzyme [Nocardioides sp.]|uniref:maleylpyruvate isomerase family mycothiol-dependent enzyme n=1 Tax=Nocardioides sp. TaxID=35761 RepID=UPI002F42E74E